MGSNTGTSPQVRRPLLADSGQVARHDQVELVRCHGRREPSKHYGDVSDESVVLGDVGAVVLDATGEHEGGLCCLLRHSRTGSGPRSEAVRACVVV